MLQYILPINARKWDAYHERALGFVSEERRERVKKYKFEQDRLLSLYAALLARMSISMFCGISNDNMHFYKEKMGKPKFLGDESIDISVSHTKNCILCSVVRSNCIGVDIEKCENAPFDIMAHVFHEKEIEYILQSVTEEEKCYRFFEMWTRKEAYGKYLGCGLTKEVLHYNTLTREFDKDIYTWKYKEYCCSVYTKDEKRVDCQEITEKEVLQYFFDVC